MKKKLQFSVYLFRTKPYESRDPCIRNLELRGSVRKETSVKIAKFIST
jgi:hypothetical protein